MEPKGSRGSLQYLEETATGPSPEPDSSSQQLPTLFPQYQF
jgi:hypothetical protein